MNEENLQNDLQIRRFLLGEMPEGERAAFEGNFIADEDLFERTRVLEDELIESYARETLSPAEKEKFERVFLATEARRRRVAFARTMLNKFANQIAAVKAAEAIETKFSIRHSIIGFFQTPKLAFGAAFAVLILMFGGWLLLRNPNQPEVVQNVAPTPTVEIVQTNANQIELTNQVAPVNSAANAAPRNSADRNAARDANRPETTNRNQNTTAPKPEPPAVIPVLALFTGTVRSEGKTAELDLPKNARGANLQLNLESQDYKIYRAEIVDADGNRVLINNSLRARNSKISVLVPAEKLRRGDYMIRLSAVNRQNENESVADYTFRVNRK